MTREHAFGHGRLAYVQIPALDVNASAAFYRDTFGWQIRGPSTSLRAGGSAAHLSFTDATGDIIGALVTDRMISTEPGVIFYVYVHGLDATINRMIRQAASWCSRRIWRAMCGSRPSTIQPVT